MTFVDTQAWRGSWRLQPIKLGLDQGQSTSNLIAIALKAICPGKKLGRSFGILGLVAYVSGHASFVRVRRIARIGRELQQSVVEGGARNGLVIQIGKTNRIHAELHGVVSEVGQVG